MKVVLLLLVLLCSGCSQVAFFVATGKPEPPVCIEDRKIDKNMLKQMLRYDWMDQWQ